MEFPLTIEIADKPVATKTYRTLIGRRSVTEGLYIVDEQERFVYYVIRRVEGKEDEYLHQGYVERIRRDTKRYNELRAWMEATAPEEEIPDDVDFMPICGLGKNPPKKILWFTQERFDHYRRLLREHSEQTREEF